MKIHRVVQPSSGRQVVLPVAKEALLCQSIHQSYAQNKRKCEEYKALWCSLTRKHSSYRMFCFIWPQFHYRDIMWVMLSLPKRHEMQLNHPLSPKSYSLIVEQVAVENWGLATALSGDTSASWPAPQLFLLPSTSWCELKCGTNA